MPFDYHFPKLNWQQLFICRSEVGSPKDAAEMSALVLKNFVSSIIKYPKILAAAVNGPAGGISAIMLGHFDLVYLSEKATFRTPLVSTAQTPGCCASYTFPRIMGRVKVIFLTLFYFFHFCKKHFQHLDSICMQLIWSIKIAEIPTFINCKWHGLKPIWFELNFSYKHSNLYWVYYFGC